MPWARASELDRSVACPASCHLARLEGPPNEAAKWGSAVHEWKESGKWPRHLRRDVIQRREMALQEAGMTRESLWPSDLGQHEVSFALHTANRLVVTHEGTGPERDAWKKSFNEDWITGTTDWYCPELAPGLAWVDDLKTGRREYLPNPTDAWQLRFYAICATMLSKADAVAVSFLSWPRSPADSAPLRIWGSEPISKTELLTLHLPMLEYARQRAVRSKTVEVNPEPGEWCRFCKSQAECPVDITEFLS